MRRGGIPPAATALRVSRQVVRSTAAVLRPAAVLLLWIALAAAAPRCLAQSGDAGQPPAAGQPSVAPPAATATEDSAQPPMLGLHAGYQRNLHRADFTGLPGVPSCCPQYDGGSGNGFALGALFQQPLGGLWVLQLRATYVMHGALLSAMEPKAVNVDGAVIPALVEHTIRAYVSDIGFEPLLGFTPFDRLTVYLGGRIAYVFPSTFDQKEQLVEPVGVGTFENDTRTRNVFSGVAIPGAASLYAGLQGMAAYRLPLSSDGVWHLVPELSWMFGLTRLASGIPWAADHARAGVSVEYALLPPPPEPPPVIPPPPPRLIVSVTASGVDAAGRNTDTARINVEEFETLDVRPLLSYLFFDEGSGTLPARYASLGQAQTAAFSVDSLRGGNALAMYYHLLDIVGSRLRARPAATLRITGCNAGEGIENGNTALSRARAETVAAYLTGVWGIDASRIAVDARDLPESPSRAGEADGGVENRRVELRSDDDAILDPIVMRSVERRITPDIIRFLPSVLSDAGVESWRLDVTGGDVPLRDFTGAAAPAAGIDWRFADDLRSDDLRNSTLRYRLAARDSAGQVAESPSGGIDVRQITVRKKRETRAEDRIISRFNLILFDFDSPQLGRRNEQIITRFILPEIGPGARIRITGYTDRIGDEKYNRTLSQQRADNAQRALRLPAESVEGKGENAPLYTNESPEGRFYNRTVEIEAETDVKR